MTKPSFPLPEGSYLSDPARVLEALAKAANVSFDRIGAARILVETQRAIPGDDPLVWAQRLVEVGESVSLRVRLMDGSLDEALTFVRQGTPVAACFQQESQDACWVVMVAAKGAKVQLAGSGIEGPTWVSRSQLEKFLRLNSESGSVRWVLGQPALPCEPPTFASHESEGKSKLTPLARMWGLLKPEVGDLWVVWLFSIVVGVLTLATPIAVEALVNTVAFGQYLQPVVVLAILLMTFLGFAAAVRALVVYVVEILQRRFFVRVVEDLAYRLPRSQWQSMDGHHPPELVNRFYDVVTVQKSAASLLMDGLFLVLQALIGMAVLAWYHPFLLGFDVILMMFIVFVIFGLGRGAVGTAIKESKCKYAIGAWLEELVRHPMAFKMHGGNHYALERADQLAVEYLEARRLHFRVLMRQILFALVMQAVAATALLGLGGWLVIQGQLTLGQLVAAELIVTVIVGSFAKLGKHMESFYDLMAAIDKLGKLFDVPIEDHNKLFHLRAGGPARLTAKNLTYRYGTGANVIGDLSFELLPGSAVALTGVNGSGKSTVIDLICGLRKPTSGHLELDGIDIRELRPDSLREHLAVARATEVFEGTIDENVHMNRPQIGASDVRQALDTVGLLNDILRMPDGLNTQLTTGGAPLSQGQAQRLAIARAIVGQPRLLLIDGSLDAESGRNLEALIDRLTRTDVPWTLLIATGREGVIRSCDDVLALDGTEGEKELQTASAV